MMKDHSGFGSQHLTSWAVWRMIAHQYIAKPVSWNSRALEWTFSIYVAFALFIWIQVQVVIISGAHWLHTFDIFWADLIIFVALLPQVRKFQKKQEMPWMNWLNWKNSFR